MAGWGKHFERMAEMAKALYSVCFRQTEREAIIKFNLDSELSPGIMPLVLIICSFQNAVCLGVCAKSLQSCLTLCDPMDCSPPGSSAHGSVRQGHWSGLPCSPPGDLPDPETEPKCLGLLHRQAGLHHQRHWEAHMIVS